MNRFNRKGYQLAAAVCLALGIGSAQAAITPGTQATASAGSGELFMMAYNYDTGYTFSIDLGVTVDAFLTNAAGAHYVGANTYWDLGANFAQFASGTGEISFNFQGSDFNYPNSSAGNLVGFRSDASPYNGQFIPSTFYTGNWKNIGQHAADLNLVMSSKGIISSQTDYATNASMIFTGANNVQTKGSWLGESGNTLGINSTFSGSAKVRATNPDQTLDLLWIHSLNGSVVKDWQNGILSLDVTAGKLVWTVPPVAVPVPAAVWTFLGGLVAMLRLQRARAA